ncbi:KGG domain-containing protein [Enterovirga rhinocerotis]|uniref:Stress-induced acidophilic repeat protein n=1 Tax=Enterovirga rhinocerotis TaxID=1339210 RepID=A0A4R7C6F3_9HYPH|nr:KGG domain-containing protein [Enterovirga rhinocerotis]TDR94164.1 stress-induced acidophilic repeat protein [Enterovirga rhinocerotis]
MSSRRGFASLSPERRAALARKGGLAVRAENRAFSRDRDLAKAAGRNGGLASRKTPAKEPE